MTFDLSMHSNQRHEFMMMYFARKPTNIDEFNILKNRLNTWVEELTVKAQAIRQRVQNDFNSVNNLDQRSHKYRLYQNRLYDVKYVLDGYLQKDVNNELQAFYNTQLDQDLINKYKYLTDITFPLYKYWK